MFTYVKSYLDFYVRARCHEDLLPFNPWIRPDDSAVGHGPGVDGGVAVGRDHPVTGE